jgi:hypothetical protein
VRSLSVELKVIASVLAVCLAAALVGAQLAGGIFVRHAESTALVTLRTAADAFAAQERNEVEKLASTLDALMGNEDLRAAFVARDRERLLAIAAPFLETMAQRDRISHWYFIEPEPSRRVFLRVHKPGLHGDVVQRATLQKAIETRDLGAGKELGKTAFALRAVRPWVHEGKLLGYVELAEEIDHFLTAMKSHTGDEYGLLVKKKFLDEQAWARVLGPRSNTWNDRPDVVVVDTTTFTEGIIDWEGDVETIADGGQAIGTVDRGDRAFVRGIFPVRDAAGRKVGGLFVLHDFTRQHADMETRVVQIFLVLFVVGLVAAAAIVALVHALVFGRLQRLRRGLEVCAEEEGLPPSRLVELESEDEVGRLERLFRRLLSPPHPRIERRGAPQSGQGAPQGAGADRR